MAIKVKARQKKINIGPSAGKYLFVMQAEIYNLLKEDKVISEAAMRSGIPKGSINAAWNAIGDVIKAWATEGHSVPIPGLGTMRFSVQADAVESVEDVKTALISKRKVIFTPSVDIKQELKETSISITCYDKDGNLIKQVTSNDKGNIDEGGSDSGNEPGGIEGI